jgi:hypothetical protein
MSALPHLLDHLFGAARLLREREWSHHHFGVANLLEL